MKIAQILLSISTIAFISCSSNWKQFKHFTSFNDTLIIQTEKAKGYGMFPGIGYHLEFHDTIETRDFHVIFPKGISNIRLANDFIDFKPWKFQKMKTTKSEDLSAFLKDNYPSKIDTNQIPGIKDNSISIISGLRGKDSIFIVDENNNKDFRDDSIRLAHRLVWKPNTDLIQVNYRIYNGKKLVNDSSWIKIGTDNYNQLLFVAAQHVIATFFFENQKYQIEVFNGPPFVRFCFDSPILALTAQNKSKKDSLTDADFLKPGDFLKLKDSYYRFEDISNDGKKITLIKEKNFAKKIGTQVGMIAREFNCKSIDGDSIRFKDYQGKYMLLVNISACYSQISSYKCYKELFDVYHGKMEILGLDKSPIFLRNNINELKLTGKFINVNENKTIEAFRPEFCSRTCFLINPEGRIIDKFEIFDWKSSLERTFGNKK
jgi:Peroxiredoxin